MALTPTPGLRVETARFGPGTVVRATRAGAVVALDRMGRLEVDVPIEQLTAIVPAPSSAVATSTAPATTSYTPASDRSAGRASASASEAEPSMGALNESQLIARRSVEALRFGIVPTHSIGDVTLGFPELERWVLKQLPTSAGDSPSVCEVCGPFGTGKSHTMAAIRHIATAQGFVTAHVEVDATSVSLSDPASVLKQLWRTLSSKDLESPTPLVDLNLRALERGRAQAVSALSTYERVCSNLLTVGALKKMGAVDRHSENLEILLACGDEKTASEVKGEILADPAADTIWGSYGDFPVDPKRLIGLRTDDRPNDFVECLLGYAVLARLAGFKGLVVTIDEFEVEAANLTRQKIDRLKGVIGALDRWLSGRGPAKTGPLSIFVATVGQEGHLGDAIVDVLVTNTGGDRHPLKPWSRAAHRQLAERIFALYCQAYGLQKPFDAELATEVQENLDESEVEGSGLIRAFIKRYVAELDAAHGPVAA